MSSLGTSIAMVDQYPHRADIHKGRQRTCQVLAVVPRLRFYRFAVCKAIVIPAVPHGQISPGWYVGRALFNWYPSVIRTNIGASN